MIRFLDYTLYHIKLLCPFDHWLSQLVQLVFRDESDSQLTLVEALHWLIVFTSVVTMLISCLWKSSLFLEMEATVKSGFYDYGGELSEDKIDVS